MGATYMQTCFLHMFSMLVQLRVEEQVEVEVEEQMVQEQV